MRNPLHNPQYAYIAPFYGQVKRIAWEYLKHYTKNIPGVVVNEAELRVDIPRANDKVRIMLLGAENPDALRGLYLDGGILDEYAQMMPSVFSEIIRPALADRKGFAIFIGTPKGRNHFFELFEYAKNDPDWFAVIYRASETGVIDPDELRALKKELDEDTYNQEFECSFNSGMVGAYYAKQIIELEKTGHILPLPYDPALTVNTYWDLGIDDTTAIWFVQFCGNEKRVIDYLEDSGKGIPQYAKILLSEKPYNYGEHVLPWDAKARELGTGKTREETFRSLGIKPTRVVARQSIEDGINAVRQVLPMCYFDAQKTKKGLDALRNYMREWDDKMSCFKNKPLHNFASHGSDAFRVFAMNYRDTFMSKNKQLPREAETEYNLFSL